jgi:hypothetical protein
VLRTSEPDCVQHKEHKLDFIEGLVAQFEESMDPKLTSF